MVCSRALLTRLCCKILTATDSSLGGGGRGEGGSHDCGGGQGMAVPESGSGGLWGVRDELRVETGGPHPQHERLVQDLHYQTHLRA